MNLGTSRRLTRNVIAVGLVSLLMGVSSQMTYSLLPLFLVTVLGASTVAVGVIEGIAEATNSVAKMIGGSALAFGAGAVLAAAAACMLLVRPLPRVAAQCL